ncbi:hypothetical protein LZG04_31120 [Saccharothrix sp. S26]|uniref:hypothetical protein n=1 Tax=Saccharothrix sp. S26 TaxID=2907215 RepID=UPI001F165D1C|nr:hypothetical protein [Saccharothrix sp. S26]MCE6999224.1 hypothetical protein [Saccharothrix sp. S26]
MPSKEELKAALHAAFDSVVEDGASYTKVYAAEIRQKNFIVLRTTTVTDFVVGFRPGGTDLVVVPVDEERGVIRAGAPVPITDVNRAAVRRRDFQGRFVVRTTDGRTFRFTVIPSVPKLLSVAYQLPVDQKEEYAAFEALRDALTAA